jgi:hypothetical protein
MFSLKIFKGVYELVQIENLKLANNIKLNSNEINLFFITQNCANICSLLEKESLFWRRLRLIIYIRISFKLDVQRTFWRLFRKRVVCTKFDIWVIIRNWQVLIVRKLENKVVLNEYFNIAKWRRTIMEHTITVCNSV